MPTDKVAEQCENHRSRVVPSVARSHRHFGNLRRETIEEKPLALKCFTGKLGGTDERDYYERRRRGMPLYYFFIVDRQPKIDPESRANKRPH